ncbi:MAG TPA: ROK family protein, partial [Acidimicrobiales bacterium]
MGRYLGLDLGGTNIKVAVIEAADDGALEVVGRDSGPTEAAGGPSLVIDRLCELGRGAVARWGPVEGAGVGVPGLYDQVSGRIELFPNLPGPWAGQAVVAPLTAGLGMPVAIINDARAFTLAETRMGAARGCSTVVCLVLGTGVGGGVVVDGRLRLGPHGRAGEIGHQVVVVDGPACGCGNRGCVEAVASAGALAELGGRKTAAEVFTAAARGDERACAAVRAVAGHLALGIANMVTVLVPERVVIGGGIAGAGDLLLEPIRQ